ncbi:MAG: MFS transporter [Ilumatobacter sp.]|jgi:2-oxoisovalerate dehydrogenase E1 component|uniref:thiamine pyrophosphate-dependent enzyme n=1 Tax=Ilumatobacter sp. TaxID=1967498 RepID=UPI001E00E705|nr:MFS transporter [Ilumatobacter sp.]MBT5554494.1 MFS transporter [Ilumatobacter sp.]MDG1391992.1 thiamine pyrophosphate-dependent enzyme [Ilumatobacter sp.]MDG2233876.1 thiamine pyrophosphate-dependent enzyme [Ilumatobacter sp.]
MNRVQVVHDNFLQRVAARDFPPRTSTLTPAEVGLDSDALAALFQAQALSRHLDRAARDLQACGEGFYTIGSSGHEGMAAVAAALRATDMAFLHYRDAAFQIARAAQVPGQDPLGDMLLSFVASSDDPISGGRHKVLGSAVLNIPPQTSTIASHLPKAVGTAYSIGLAKRIRPEHAVLADDGLVICSFGDASLNHASAQSALNTAGWTSFQGVPLPLLFLCEDNGLGISVKTPAGWVEASMRNRAGIEYMHCSGLDLADTYAAVTGAARRIRATRRPVFLHLDCVRLYGHAGADVASSYLSPERIERDEANDPLLHSARLLVEHGDFSPAQVVDIYTTIEAEVTRRLNDAVGRPKLQTSEDVMSSIVPPPRWSEPTLLPTKGQRIEVFGRVEITAMAAPQHLAKLLNWAITDEMLRSPEIIVAGEDVGAKGGVYGVTQRLQKRFGQHRVIDTILDEQSILGMGIGLAHNGFVPVVEIQFLAYLHNAEDQLRGEAATLPFFSNGQFANPMIIRIAGLGYQRGFGGHFHNDNSLAVLRDIPGIVIACPSNGTDAVHMFRECIRLARDEQRVVVFIEPIARYMTRDLLTEGDERWAGIYPEFDPQLTMRSGTIGVRGDGTDLAIVTYGNGVFLAEQAVESLRADDGINVRIIDLRWLAPLPIDAVVAATAPCRSVLVVDECRETGSQSEAIVARFAERGRHDVYRECAADSFIATGPAFGATLPSRESIVAAARRAVSDLS